jgi:hypothetical protein
MRAAANRQDTRCWLQPAFSRRLWMITAFMLTATAAAVHRGDQALGACSGENPLADRDKATESVPLTGDGR